MAYILYCIDALDVVRRDRRQWIAWIRSPQNVRDGSFTLPQRTNPTNREELLPSTTRSSHNRQTEISCTFNYSLIRLGMGRNPLPNPKR